MKKISVFYFLFIFLFSFLALLFVTPNFNLTQAVNEPCGVPYRACDPPLICKPENSTPNSKKTCQTPIVGDDCNGLDPNSCGPNLVCTYVPGDSSNTCRIKPPPAAKGKACTYVSGCETGSTCKDTTISGKHGLFCVVEKTAPPPCAEGKIKDGKCTEFTTGLGSFPTNAGGFISKIFAVILAVSGGIALLLIIRAGYKIMTSQGNPEKVKEGREQLMSAIVGLLFLIFSFVLLELIGVDILRIPGLS